MPLPHAPTPDEWSALFRAPVESDPAPDARHGRKLAVKEANDKMWQAIKTQQTPQLAQALRQGAQVQRARKNKLPLQMAVGLSYWDGVKLLMGHGATMNGWSPWALIRDDPADAEMLLAFGVAPPTREEAKLWVAYSSAAMRLMDWYLARVPDEEAHQVVPSLAEMHRASETRQWVNLPWLQESVANGPARLRDRLLALWGVAPTEPWALVNALQALTPHPNHATSELTQKWGDAVMGVAANEDIGLIRQLFETGWGIPGMAEESFQDFGWSLAQNRCFKVLEWWCSVPALAERMRQAGEADPEQWWKVAHQENPQGNAWIDRMGYAGAKGAQLTNAAGDTVLHDLDHHFNLETRAEFYQLMDQWSSALDVSNRKKVTPRAQLKQGGYAEWLTCWEAEQTAKALAGAIDQVGPPVKAKRPRL